MATELHVPSSVSARLTVAILRHDGRVSASLRGLATSRGNLSVVSAPTAHINVPIIAGIIFNTRKREGVWLLFWGVKKLVRLRNLRSKLLTNFSKLIRLVKLPAITHQNP